MDDKTKKKFDDLETIVFSSKEAQDKRIKAINHQINQKISRIYQKVGVDEFLEKPR
jgi:hypothetical protein